MKTLIELYDERPLDNVLATEMFRPETTVYLCPPEVAQNRTLKENLRMYFRSRGCDARIVFVPVSLMDAGLDGRVRQLFAGMIAGPGAVRETLHRVLKA